MSEIDRLTAERDAYAREALTALAGAVCTPERGYVNDGGPGLMGADIRRLRTQHDCLLAACKAVTKAAREADSEERFGELVSETLESLNAAIARAERS